MTPDDITDAVILNNTAPTLETVQTLINSGDLISCNDRAYFSDAILRTDREQKEMALNTGYLQPPEFLYHKDFIALLDRGLEQIKREHPDVLKAMCAVVENDVVVPDEPDEQFLRTCFMSSMLQHATNHPSCSSLTRQFMMRRLLLGADPELGTLVIVVPDTDHRTEATIMYEVADGAGKTYNVHDLLRPA